MLGITGRFPWWAVNIETTGRALYRPRTATLRRRGMHVPVGGAAWSMRCWSEDFGPSINSSCCPRQDLRGMKRRVLWGHISDCSFFATSRWQRILFHPVDEKDIKENYFPRIKRIIQRLIEPKKQIFCDGKGHSLYSTKSGSPLSDCMGTFSDSLSKPQVLCLCGY